MQTDEEILNDFMMAPIFIAAIFLLFIFLTVEVVVVACRKTWRFIWTSSMN